MCLDRQLHTHHAHEHRHRRRLDGRGHEGRPVQDQEGRGRGRLEAAGAAGRVPRDPQVARQARVAGRRIHRLDGSPSRARGCRQRAGRAAGGQGQRAVLVVDSSVWIDFFNGCRRAVRPSCWRHLLDHGEVRIVVPDLVLFEVLRGFRHERDLRTARQLMQGLAIESSMDPSWPWPRPSTIASCAAGATRCAAPSTCWWRRSASSATTRCCTTIATSMPSSSIAAARMAA